MAFAPALRKLTFTTHVTTSVGWIGAVLVFLTMAAIGLSSQDERIVRGAYLVMAPAAWFVLVPLAHASLLSGIVLSLGTPWGLFRHYWVLVKLLLTLFAITILFLEVPTVRGMAMLAASTADPRTLPGSLPHSIGAIVVLLVIAVLSIYKPKGVTRYGWRKQQEHRPESA